MGGATAERPQPKELMKALASSNVVITPAVDWLSRNITHLIVIGRDIQQAAAGLRTQTEPVLGYHRRLRRARVAMLGVACQA